MNKPKIHFSLNHVSIGDRRSGSYNCDWETAEAFASIPEVQEWMARAEPGDQFDLCEGKLGLFFSCWNND